MAATTTKYVFDLQPGDVYWCTADCGWITGHTYLTYGPLLCGAQCVVFEGVPSYPTPGRSWQVVEKYKVCCWRGTRCVVVACCCTLFIIETWTAAIRGTNWLMWTTVAIRLQSHSCCRHDRSYRGSTQAQAEQCFQTKQQHQFASVIAGSEVLHSFKAEQCSQGFTSKQ